MNNDLIVMTFTTEEGASKTQQALELMRGSKFWGLADAIIITRDSSGKALVHQRRESPAFQRSPDHPLLDVLADEILGADPEEGLRKMVELGLSETFLKGIISALIPNSSAILLYIRSGSLVNPQQVLDALRQFIGTVHHTTVPAQVEAAVLGQDRRNMSAE